MPFGIPSEDFHGGFGLPHDEDDYEPHIDKYADLGFGENWVSESPEMPDEDREIAKAAQEAHDELVRSLIEAGGEIRELNDEKKRLIFTLKEAVVWLNYFLTTERNDIYYDDANEVRCRAEYLLIDLEDTQNE